MAGIPGKGGVKGRSGPPGNMNAFKHGLASIEKRREEGVPTQHEENVRQQILDGLIADKGGDDQISTATRILAEVIASDASWLMAFNNAMDYVMQNNPKARQNPRGLSQLDGYKRGDPPLNANHVIISTISAGASRVLAGARWTNEWLNTSYWRRNFESNLDCSRRSTQRSHSTPTASC
jgi:hypothetical protein